MRFHPCLLLFALLLPSCEQAPPYTVCLAPVNLNLSEPLASYEFWVSGPLENGLDYASSSACPGSFSGGYCDERRITFRDIDNHIIVLDLRLLVMDQVVLEDELVIDAISDGQCTSGGTREVDVVL